ncbi:hypothetical protein [Capillimicrobium parvum]|uniref:EfeO-type cupredoxin-like domain-containing protein n=1 Tax=Capillimicrobium parvum TaxID=2884022 RepID=A0A9E7C2G2_9ACTN|nr:hypothetical protein [Capillimicrobium parvum]UGS37724.1 hypothetical protein DSM104329_04145 [Capillimicrobium parvum]
MSTNQRFAMLALAGAVLVVGFFVLRSGGDANNGDTATATIVRTVVTETTPGGQTTTTKTVQEKPKKPKVPVVVVKGGKPVGGVEKLEFNKGGTIDFRVRSDTPGEIHFHGYDVHRDVPQGGGTVRFRLPAKFDGRFVVEVEDSGVEIAEVEVQP